MRNCTIAHSGGTSHPSDISSGDTGMANPSTMGEMSLVKRLLAGVDPGFFFFFFFLGGGGGRKRLCARTHVTSAEPNSLSEGVHAGPT